MEIDKMTMVTTKEEFKEYLLEFISTYKADIPKLVELEVSLRDEKNAFNEYPSTPKTPNLTAIRSTGEKAFQRGIINGKYSFLDYKNGNNEKVTWLDLELPVVLNQNPRRCCLDLLGSLDGISLLCELKFFEKTPHLTIRFMALLSYLCIVILFNVTMKNWINTESTIV